MKHVWIRASHDEGWGGADPKAVKEGWSEVLFRCYVCGVRGHVMYKEGPFPEMPEEVLNEETGQLVDPLGECEEQLVESIHAY